MRQTRLFGAYPHCQVFHVTQVQMPSVIVLYDKLLLRIQK